jgi:hypothetical protein
MENKQYVVACTCPVTQRNLYVSGAGILPPKTENVPPRISWERDPRLEKALKMNALEATACFDDSRYCGWSPRVVEVTEQS